jgi:hypothetical protein
MLYVQSLIINPHANAKRASLAMESINVQRMSVKIHQIHVVLELYAQTIMVQHNALVLRAHLAILL